MRRGAQLGILVAALVALAGCGKTTTTDQARTPATTQSTPSPSTPAPSARAPRSGDVPPVDPDTTPQGQIPEQLLRRLVPKGVPTRSTGEMADPQQLAVVQRWLQALTDADLRAAADTFADGATVQNGGLPQRLDNRAARLEFNRSFPCGAEVTAASSVQGYLIVVFRLTDRRGSPCDGPGGTAASTIKVEGDRMTEWYRLPNPPSSRGDNGDPAPVV
ncbi:MAG: hypothetical protein ACR2NB_07460 [Solirubrobacteraceae bacterium]